MLVSVPRRSSSEATPFPSNFVPVVIKFFHIYLPNNGSSLQSLRCTPFGVDSIKRCRTNSDGSILSVIMKRIQYINTLHYGEKEVAGTVYST